MAPIADGPCSCELSCDSYGNWQPGCRIGQNQVHAGLETAGNPRLVFTGPRRRDILPPKNLDVTIDQGEGSAATVTRVMSGAYDAGFGDINAIIQNAATKPAETPVMVYMIYSKAPFALLTKADVRSRA